MAQDSHRNPPAWTALRAWLGLTLAGIGVVLLWYGWYRVAGETLVAAQLPYLVSASLPGGALLLAGIVLVGTEIGRRGAAESDAMVAALYRLLTEEDTEPGEPTDPTESSQVASPDTAAAAIEPGALVALAGGTTYHTPGCLLVEGKAGVRPVDAAEIREAGLEPCPVCRPARPMA